MNHTDYSHLLPLAEVARRLPSNKPGKKMHISTVYRWVLSGRLPAVKIGGSFFVDPADLARLVEPVAIPPKQTSSRAWAKDQEAAEQRVRDWLKRRKK